MIFIRTIDIAPYIKNAMIKTGNPPVGVGPHETWLPKNIGILVFIRAFPICAHCLLRRQEGGGINILVTFKSVGIRHYRHSHCGDDNFLKVESIFTLRCGQIYGPWPIVLLITNHPAEVAPYIRPLPHWLVFFLRYRLEETGISSIYGFKRDRRCQHF